jgi:hypothetical protein
LQKGYHDELNTSPRFVRHCAVLFRPERLSYAAEPYTLDGKDLAFSRQQIAAKDPLFVQAQAALLKKPIWRSSIRCSR